MPSPSPYSDDSNDIEELDYRTRKLNNILRKNINRTEKRKSVLDVVRDKAWLLEDQVKILEKQTGTFRNTLIRQSCRRRIIVLVAVILSLILIVNTSILTGLYDLVEGFLQKLSGKPRKNL